ncbi:MAG: response regulator [Patescibacteria group bacterium]
MNKVLLIDDEALVLRLFKRIFTPVTGFELSTAWDGMEGLQKIKEVKPDLVLLDIRMPKIDGLEVLRRIKADKEIARIPVIMLTNLSDTKLVSEAVSLGARGYLIKTNYKPDEILELVRSTLN